MTLPTRSASPPPASSASSASSVASEPPHLASLQGPQQTRASFVDVTEEQVEVIAAIGASRAPREACGLLLPYPSHSPESIVEVPNTSPTPEVSYEVTRSAILDALAVWAAGVGAPFLETHGDSELGFVVWHTHPSGRVGPSRGDTRTRVPGVQYLVVALPEGPGQPIASRY